MIEYDKPMDIERRSFEIITQLLGEQVIPAENELVVKRVIHTTADFDYAENLAFSDHAVAQGIAALRAGCDIVTDTQMARSGINKRVLEGLGGQVHCFMSEAEVAALAGRRGSTRAAASMRWAAEHVKKPCIFAVGNAPTALLELGELALFDHNGTRVSTNDSAEPLLDEQDTVPDAISWFNSAYFDEIYHPRTALEHIEGVSPYEISHPPLGKLILGLGIRLFGMTPFGWRFMGTLFGVAMLPLLYVFLKNLFGRTAVAACGTVLLAADFMHLTQTRIGTIDTYGVFFILLMYYFLYRYLTLPAGAPFRKCALPLFLSGLFWGIGAASKWTVIYGCVGLALLYFIGLYQKLRDWPREERHARTAWTFRLLAFSVLCFALIPAVIYVLSYYPYAQAKGDTSLSGWLGVMWENQKYMFSYHKGVVDTHPYSSRWYQWILDIRPILYYLDSSLPGYTTRFGAFLNPVVCWGGLLAMIAVAVRMVQRRCGKALFILVGYLSQLAPWFLIGRITFAYHYFPSVIFLILALCYVFHDLAEREDAVRWKPAVYALTGGAAVLYAMFYPVLVGITVPTWYTTCFLRWFPSWPF